MKVLIFLVVNLAVSGVTSRAKVPEIVEIGEDKDIIEANKGSLHDDIMTSKIQRSAIINDNQLWTSPVPYVLDDSLEMNARGVIIKSFDQFRLKSCIDFKARDNEDYFISFQKLGGCFSYVGRVEANGQTLSIGRYCDEISTVEHEILHALGFFHEQSRYDRDSYVEIEFDNIVEGFENNFEKVGRDSSTTNGVSYDYWSVMHYGQNAFSNGNGSTIFTKDPSFQDIIGQRLEMSPKDVLELNRRYSCNSTIAFKMYCGFSGGTLCQMNHCSWYGQGWKVTNYVYGGPHTDHTSLPNNASDAENTGYFMHASTEYGQVGDTARLETPRMRVNRKCNVQCLQFYYYNSGNESDQLNIWLREFQGVWDTRGRVRFVGQITGQETTHWQLHHVSLNATKEFLVEFEVRKGEGSSQGGFSIDDINLSETECPHVTMQIDEFEHVLNTSEYGDIIFSPQQNSRGGYAYRVGIALYRTYIGLFVQLLSGEYDDELEWPCPQRQVTFTMVDQTPNIMEQMSKQRSITSDLRLSGPNGTYLWGNPREVGTPFVIDNETFFAGPLLGRTYFANVEEMERRQFLKGGSAIFSFYFEDLTPLVNGSVLPCPTMRPVDIEHPPRNMSQGPCPPRIVTTVHPPPQTTDDRRILTTFHPPPQTTDDRRNLTTFHPPPQTTDDRSIFGFSPGLMASPVLTLLLALMLLTY